MSLQSHYNNGVLNPNLNLQANMGTIQIRIDEQTKKSAKKILEGLGLDISGAVKIYLKQIILRKGLPFKVLTENGMTPEEEEEILRIGDEMSKGINCVGPFTGEEFIEHMKKLIEKKK